MKGVLVVFLILLVPALHAAIPKTKPGPFNMTFSTYPEVDFLDFEKNELKRIVQDPYSLSVETPDKHTKVSFEAKYLGNCHPLRMPSKFVLDKVSERRSNPIWSNYYKQECRFRVGSEKRWLIVPDYLVYFMEQQLDYKRDIVVYSYYLGAHQRELFFTVDEFRLLAE